MRWERMQDRESLASQEVKHEQARERTPCLED